MFYSFSQIYLMLYSFNIDRGGTFTDFYVQTILHPKIISEHCFKVPSLSHQGEGPIVGVKKFMIHKGLMTSENDKIPVQKIASFNIGTTIATNALLQRKGCPNVMIVSEGFKDCLQIRTQTRPDIFDLKCKTLPPLATQTLEIDARIYCHQLKNIKKDLHKVEEGVYYEKPSEMKLNQLIKQLKQIKPASIGISIANSYLSSVAQDQLQQCLRAQGFHKIEKGSSFQQMGYLKRTQTANLDAYLNPLIQNYFSDLLKHFDKPQELNIKIMKSDGGFTSARQINASSMLLSGPAGGLIGYCRMKNLLQKDFGLKVGNLLGLDMGGTSTDVSKVKNQQLVLNYSFEAQGIQICTPHLQIQTIAAGGGSQLTFQRGILSVGPESVGSNPGPVCYGIGSQLALTDANLILNRLDPSFFPKVFGKDKNSSIDREISIKQFEILALQINKTSKNPKSIYEIAEGYVQIANQLMAKSARKILTLGRPDALIIFGSAAGQHCCDVAEKIGVQNVFIHRFSGILSAYGMSKAYETKQVKIFIGQTVQAHSFDFDELKKLIKSKKECEQNLSHYQKQYDEITCQLSIGYVGTSYTFKVPLSANALVQFQKQHRQENGFVLPQKRYKIQYLIETYISLPQQYKFDEQKSQIQGNDKFLLEHCEVYFEKQFHKIGKYLIEGMKNCNVDGPALLMSSTSSIFVKKNWKAHIMNSNIKLTKNLNKNVVNKQNVQDSMKTSEQFQVDPIKLTIYSTRLMGIAEQMGKVLRKTSISTNIKQRLDFSCGIFDWDGNLLANAPHLPVHLGSMEVTVMEQIKRGIKPGDVVLTNHPIAGGSHLPDLTVISCFQLQPGCNFFVASRGHHADIGGITPGSMPPFSKFLYEEGVAIETFSLVQNGQFVEIKVRELFSQSRRTDDNVSDLVAQISANQIGMRLIKKFFIETGFQQFNLYVKLICENARECVQDLLVNFSRKQNFPDIHTIYNEEYMDDGTPLKLKLMLDRVKKRAVFDFTGTGPQVLGNTNAPKSITRSAVLYCLRSLIGKSIPLNSGCLKPVDIIIPDNCILSPSKDAAVVGGNVETSQKLVDLILKPFNYVACSQGTMNNFLFGNKRYSYYETICGGSGAGDGFEGRTVQCHMTNTRITDVEHLQRYYPVVLKRFQKRKNSGGKGRFKGGEGVIRQMLFLESMEVSILSQRRVFRAYGLMGGQHGDVGHNYLITQQGLTKHISSKSHFIIEPYQIVRIETPGGGGYGVSEKESDL